MKLLGAALILCGAALQCHALLGARRQERAALRELSAALEGLERGIRVSLMPLPRLLGQRGAGKYADAFFADVLAQLENGTPLPDGWREAAARTPLGEREQALLSGLADAFGGEEDAVLPLTERRSAPCARRRRRCAVRSWSGSGRARGIPGS